MHGALRFLPLRACLVAIDFGLLQLVPALLVVMARGFEIAGERGDSLAELGDGIAQRALAFAILRYLGARVPELR